MTFLKPSLMFYKHYGNENEKIVHNSTFLGAVKELNRIIWTFVSIYCLVDSMKVSYTIIQISTGEFSV